MQKTFIIIGIISLLALSFLTLASDYERCNNFFDGPYIFEKNDERVAYWVCNKSVKSKKYKYQPNSLITLDQRSVWLGNKPAKKSLQTSFKGDFNVAAVSDIHGQFDLFLSLLKNNQIVDENGHWNFGTGHFVITGDVFDRGAKVTETLWYLYQLEQQAKVAGGKVHLLLGNHEVMVLNGDLRYLNEKYVASSLSLNKSYDSLFSKNSILGDWLRSRPVLVKVNDMLFAHGGFHPDLATNNWSLNKINSIFTDNLVKSELNQERNEQANYLHTSNGPVWYRGYFKDDGATEKQINQLLKYFNIAHLIVGHTSQDIIQTRFDGKVIAIDASMKNGHYGEILLKISGEFYRGTLSGKKLMLDI